MEHIVCLFILFMLFSSDFEIVDLTRRSKTLRNFTFFYVSPLSVLSVGLKTKGSLDEKDHFAHFRKKLKKFREDEKMPFRYNYNNETKLRKTCAGG